MNQGPTLNDTTLVEREIIELDQVEGDLHVVLKLFKPPDLKWGKYAITAELFHNADRLESDMRTTNDPRMFAPKAAELVERIYGRHVLDWNPPQVHDENASEFTHATNRLRQRLQG